MKRQATLVLPQKISDQLRDHLFPGDGLEAAALLLCTQVGKRRSKLLGRQIIAVPYLHCTRRLYSITWPDEYVEVAIDRAAPRGDIVIAVHSHPGGYFAFSDIDDKSDLLLMGALQQGTDQIAGSATMIPDGAMRARIYENGRTARSVDLTMVVGTDIFSWWDEGATPAGPILPAMAFTSAMRAWLGRLSVCVIGVSGTGSIVAEQLARLGVGEIILIDFDRLEDMGTVSLQTSLRRPPELSLIFLSVIATDLTVGVQGPTSNAREHPQSPYHRERDRLYNCQTV